MVTKDVTNKEQRYPEIYLKKYNSLPDRIFIIFPSYHNFDTPYKVVGKRLVKYEDDSVEIQGKDYETVALIKDYRVTVQKEAIFQTENDIIPTGD